MTHSARSEPRILVSGGHRLDAVLTRPTGAVRGAAAVAHPHPAHGGHMDHPVVVAAADRLVAAGFAALRFDVRGVRHSDGDPDDAAGHLEDLFVAARAAAAEAPGALALGAGFSYGARLWLEAAHAPAPPPVAGLLLLAPATRVPRTARDFGDLLLGRPLRDATLDLRAIERLERLSTTAEVLVGEHDAVAPPSELERHRGRATRVTVLPGLNHFFSRQTGSGSTDDAALLPALDAAISRLAPPSPRPPL